MKVGMMGIGKLGLPVALAMEKHGHEVMAYDPAVVSIMTDAKVPAHEAGVADLLPTSKIRNVYWDPDGLAEFVRHSEIIFVAVPTPHDTEYGGEQPIPERRRDFDYSQLVSAVRKLVNRCHVEDTEKTIVVISTVLPGTIRRLVLPLVEFTSKVTLLYNPFFIAMGTVIRDFENPEFILIGDDRSGRSGIKTWQAVQAVDQLTAFYLTIVGNKRVSVMTYENAELTKVAYNTFIGMKLAFANTLMEICHKVVGCDVDVVSNTLAMATDRLISSAYLNGGMGDGGACHPRDNIAMSWLARELKLSHDIFTDVMQAREDQTAFLADLVVEEHRRSGLPICIAGLAYKPNTNLLFGSPALLLKYLLVERGYAVRLWDPLVTTPGADVPQEASVFIIACAHDVFADAAWPPGSIVIDPWRQFAKPGYFCYVPVGVGK